MLEGHGSFVEGREMGGEAVGVLGGNCANIPAKFCLGEGEGGLVGNRATLPGGRLKSRGSIFATLSLSPCEQA